MERLTAKRVNGIKHGYWSPATKEKLVQRLAEYEDTGLTPEEIKAWNEIGGYTVIGEVKEANTWIPSSERLPEIGQRVIICRQKEKGVPYIEQAFLIPGGWWKVYGTNVKKVDYWMPMPAAPEEVPGK